ncbi:hypothetical protein [Flavobacterium sp.]|uniref:hypothetical protein n=1 Tax=Flavobacterium sp. TaxID=239 RepID=UPI00261672C1|nr:hypothetical protein [Flavobacterium sp.]MDD3005041.1 hypothetical protein [Flavobacterium sp.]
MEQHKNRTAQDAKFKDLGLSLLLDTIGMVSFSIPLIGEFSDVIWAPISGLIMAKMHQGTHGKVAGIFSFLEELLPVTDFIPTFTIMWFYKYYIKKAN